MRSSKPTIAARAAVLLAVSVISLAAFCFTLLRSADVLTTDERQSVEAAIVVLENKGFRAEVLMLRRFAFFRRNDNWLNASVAKENAFAATNFPFEIVTLYPDFFTNLADNIERAAVLLHEAKHLEGKNEKRAYEFVWKNRTQLGWTQEIYGASPVWNNVRKQTKEYSPGLFRCDFNPFGDCTEKAR